MFEIIIAWNTGCRYTREGQRIAAGITHDREVYFVDVDREVGGKLFDHWDGAMRLLDADWIHNRYLRNEYDGISMSDGEWVTLDHCAHQIEGVTD